MVSFYRSNRAYVSTWETKLRKGIACSVTYESRFGSISNMVTSVRIEGNRSIDCVNI